MKSSEIRLAIELDEENVPDKIFWRATDAQKNDLQEAKAVCLSVWDHQNQESLRIDLWTKDMPVHEMKMFFVDMVGGLAQTILTATDDKYMHQQTFELMEKLIKHVKREISNEQNEL